jgi:hypothetical protein
LGDDLAHCVFDLFEVLLRKGPLDIKIVVETIFNGRADGNAGFGKNRSYGLGHDVSGAVPKDFDRLGAIFIYCFQGSVPVELLIKIDELAVKFCRYHQFARGCLAKNLGNSRALSNL